MDLLKRKQVFSPITPQPQDISIPGRDFPPFSQFCPLVAESSRPAHSTIFIPGEAREHLLCTLQGWSQTQLGSVPNMQPGGFADSRMPGTEQIKLKMATLTPQQEDRELKPSTNLLPNVTPVETSAIEETNRVHEGGLRSLK